MALWVFTLILLLSGIPDGIAASNNPERILEFGNLSWGVKASKTKIGPGPNYWSDSVEHIWVDEAGMHLTVQLSDEGTWLASEVYTKQELGYGTYTFVVDSDITNYHSNLVAGFFTWDHRPAENNREIDIEFASWGTGQVTGQYVVQPVISPERIEVFNPAMRGTFSTHRIIWTPSEVSFSSYHGDVDPDSPQAQAQRMHQWSFQGEPPTEGKAHFRINLWLFRGTGIGDRSSKLTVREFRFEPLR
ncbi:MAG: family 16 glycosylhydrolase [Spirochaetota bacterium]